MQTVYAGHVNLASIRVRVQYEENSRRDEVATRMALGYDGKLYILAFDHRGSFQKKMFGIAGDPTPEETRTIADGKQLIFEGMEIAVERGVDAAAAGVLVDEQFGGDIPTLAREHGLKRDNAVEHASEHEFEC